MANRVASKPKALRLLRAKMELLELSLSDVATKAGISYSLTSDVLRGRVISANAFKKIQRAIETERELDEPAYRYFGYPDN